MLRMKYLNILFHNDIFSKKEKEKEKPFSHALWKQSVHIFFFYSLIKDGRLGDPMRESFEGNIAYKPTATKKPVIVFLYC